MTRQVIYRGETYRHLRNLWESIVKPRMSYGGFAKRVRKLGLADAIEMPLMDKSQSGRKGADHTRYKFRLAGSLRFNEKGERV